MYSILKYCWKRPSIYLILIIHFLNKPLALMDWNSSQSCFSWFDMCAWDKTFQDFPLDWYLYQRHSSHEFHFCKFDFCEFIFAIFIPELIPNMIRQNEQNNMRHFWGFLHITHWWKLSKKSQVLKFGIIHQFLSY